MDCMWQRGLRTVRERAAPRSFEPDFGFDRHSDAQAMAVILTRLETDSDRQALYYFHVIAGGVFRRHQAVLLATRSANSLDVALVGVTESVNIDRRALAWPHAANLRLLKIRGDPDIVERNNRKE